MSTPTPPPAGGLLRSRRLITTARGRNTLMGDGGGTGKGDGND
ncbi:hypothetical protein [Actinacidiphila oryziradicis]|nr:hypothetical protein [Actinacidiphila oryziradicis]